MKSQNCKRKARKKKPPDILSAIRHLLDPSIEDASAAVRPLCHAGLIVCGYVGACSKRRRPENRLSLFPAFHLTPRRMGSYEGRNNTQRCSGQK